ncbi:MAG: DUF3131 domain-containing protein [Deltaproteobacteria bacterium]|nr:DUF3131 domain-containing protein [Deltaproteobacteria bacterium]
MTFKEGLIKARSHIIFIIGLIVGFSIVITLSKWDIEKEIREKAMVKIEKTADINPAPSSSLTDKEKKWAKVAWKYFEINYIPETGMVNSVDKYKASTMWDTASYMIALISAKRLGIIDDTKFDLRLSKLLDTLGRIPLFDNALPNKSYNTITLDMVDYNNKKTKRGIGWSAIDIGRLLVPFNIIVWNYPSYSKKIARILKRWQFDKMVKDGQLFGAGVDSKGKTVYLQEGRLGYEEYGAKSLLLMGYDLSVAMNYKDFLSYVDIYGIKVPYDSRSPEKYHAHNYVVSEPYILDGIEFGWDLISKEFAYRVYKAQEERFKHTGILTAVSEDNIDRAPYFVYNTLFTDGKPWNCITATGENASEFRSISTKAVFGWYVLYRTEYTKKLIDKIEKLFDPKRGWYSGLYEKDKKPNKAITCNTNGIILESLCYKNYGKHVNIY